MKTVRKRHWFFIHLLCLLVGTLVDSSSLSSPARSQYITSKVGNQVVLPCSWKPRLGEVAPSACHIQWTALDELVFEALGERKWQAEEFEGRAEVPEEKLGSGDCSLVISDVQIGDAGSYESYMVVDGVRATKTRVSIQSVKLSVFDHKSRQSRAPGEDLVLDLHTRHSVRVVFQNRNSSEWSDLWMRGDRDGERLQKHPLRELLTLRKLRSSDQGTYKVLDEQGLAVSTVQLDVEKRSVSLPNVQTLENEARTDDAVRSSCSALLLLSALVTTFQILHLL